jgi:ferredoxin-thioredoxin reductase catalytic subunit
MNKEKLLKVWERFSEGNDFMLNPDQPHVDMILEGVLRNEKEYGLKLCPCRLRNGTRERDLELICPCNFKAHETWQKEGRCWCGLFVKRKG